MVLPRALPWESSKAAHIVGAYAVEGDSTGTNNRVTVYAARVALRKAFKGWL